MLHCEKSSVIRWSVGRLVVVCVWGHSVSHGVYPLWAARLSARPCMLRSWGGSRPLQNEFVSARACVRVLCLNRRRSSGSGYSF